MLIYFHRNPKTFDIFYVGMSNNSKRPRRMKGSYRNKEWEKEIELNGRPIIQIVLDKLTIDEAIYWERYYISLLGKQINGGMLVNNSSGGKGNAGYKGTEKQIKASSERMLLRGNGHMMTPEARKKAIANISKALTGKLMGDKNPNFGNKWTDEMKKNLSEKKRKMHADKIALNSNSNK